MFLCHVLLSIMLGLFVLQADCLAVQPSSEQGLSPFEVAPTDWPWWRGPYRNGMANSDQQPPLQWSEDENVIWKSPVLGIGHSSPTIVGDHIFLATADVPRDTQLVLCYDRQTGHQLWSSSVHSSGIVNEGNEKASPASSTIAFDGQRLIVNFLNNGAIHTSALDLQGNKIWQTKISDYVVHQGYGASPAIYGALVIVTADNKGGGAVVGLDRATGAVVWKHERPDTPNYASPIIHHVAGRDQLLLIGCDLVAGFVPLSGKKLWEIEGATTECVTSPITDGELVFSSGGYPDNHISAIKADGSGEVVWRNKTRVYVPSMLIKDAYLYAVLDAGVAMCWKAATGEEIWKGRLGGTFSASPVLVGDRIFATNESGTTFVFKTTSDGFHIVAENHLAGQVMATPVFCGSRIYMRAASQDGDNRRESLYCLGLMRR